MKRMFACLLLILVVPIITALIQPGARGNSPFASTAIAGHTLAGGLCRCGGPGCICDAGEDPNMFVPENRVPQPLADSANVPASSSGADVPAAALFIGTVLLILKRLL